MSQFWENATNFQATDVIVTERITTLNTGLHDDDDMDAQRDRPEMDAMSLVYTVLTFTMSALSIAGCVLILADYLAFKPQKTSVRKLLNYLTVADLLTAVGNVVGVAWMVVDREVGTGFWGRGFLCQFHSALTIYSSISSYLWTVAMTLYLYFSLGKCDNHLADKTVPVSHVICWFVPGVVTTVGLALGVMGEDENVTSASWCWIHSGVRYADIMFWQYFTGKAWEMAALAATVILTAMLRWSLYKQVQKSKFLFTSGDSRAIERRQSLISTANRRMTFVPVVFLVCRVWGTVRFIIGAHFPHIGTHPGFLWIVPLQGLGDSAQGFANGVVYCIHNRRLRDCMCPHFAPRSDTSVDGKHGVYVLPTASASRSK